MKPRKHAYYSQLKLLAQRNQTETNSFKTVLKLFVSVWFRCAGVREPFFNRGIKVKNQPGTWSPNVNTGFRDMAELTTGRTIFVTLYVN